MKSQPSSNAGAISLWHKVAFSSMLTAITALFYYPSLSYDFQFDDLANITKKFDIRFFNLFSFSNLFTGRWISDLLSRVNYQIGRFDPYSYRLVNVGLHIATGILLFFLILKVCQRARTLLLSENAPMISLLTSGLFLLHPVQTQTVSYIIQGRLEGPACLFTIASALCFIGVVDAQSKRVRSLLTVLLCTLSFLSFGTKEIIIVAPFLLAILDWFLISHQDWKTFKSHLWIHGLFGGVLFGMFMYHRSITWFTNILGLKMTMLNNRGNIITTNASDLITPYAYLISEFKVILHYLLIFFWPFDISVEYDWKLSESLFAPDSFFPLIALLAIGFFVLRSAYHKARPEIAFGLAWFFTAIAPRSTIVPSSELIVDYKTYVASVGIVFIIAILLARAVASLATALRVSERTSLTFKLILSTLSLVAVAYGGVIVTIILGAPYNLKTFAILLLFIPAALFYIVYLLATRHTDQSLYSPISKAAFSLLLLIPIGYAMKVRNGVWSSPVAFWGDIVFKAPGKARGHNNYGVGLSEAGRFEEAIKHYKHAIKLDAQYPDPWSNLAVAYSVSGKVDMAIAALKNAIRIFPNYPEAYNNLGAFLLQKKEYNAAEQCFDIATQLRPWYGKAYLNKGRLYLERGENEQAWNNFKRATEGDLDNQIGYTALGEVSIKLKKYKEALAAFQKACSLGPAHQKIIFNLANSYYMTQQFPQAEALYKQLTANAADNAHYLYNLGETYFAQGKYQEALGAFNTSKSLPSALPQSHFRVVHCLEKLEQKNDAKSYLNALVGAQGAPEWFVAAAKQELARVDRGEKPGAMPSMQVQPQTT